MQCRAGSGRCLRFSHIGCPGSGEMFAFSVNVADIRKNKVKDKAEEWLQFQRQCRKRNAC